MKFIEVTIVGGTKLSINTGTILSFYKREGNTTTINTSNFACSTTMHFVKETYEQIKEMLEC